MDENHICQTLYCNIFCTGLKPGPRFTLAYSMVVFKIFVELLMTTVLTSFSFVFHALVNNIYCFNTFQIIGL